MKRLSERPWKALSTKPIYANRWLSLREDLVELPDLARVESGGSIDESKAVDKEFVRATQRDRATSPATGVRQR
jgi:hypothetical protein